MNTLEVVPDKDGIVFGFGATNARVGTFCKTEMENFYSVETPKSPDEFFGWMAPQILEAAHKRNSWVVAGFPGPVTPDGLMIGPMANVDGLADEQYNLAEELIKADSAMADLLEDKDFTFLAVNDGDLAAQAAASFALREKRAFNKIAALIIGTGVGAGAAKRDEKYANVCRIDRSNALEVGHPPQSNDPKDTPENAISAPALTNSYGDPRELDETNLAWREVGQVTARLAATLGLWCRVDLVVPCGGIGAGASEKYKPHLEEALERFRQEGNKTQRLHLPNVLYIPSKEAHTFEMHGGPGIVRDFDTRNSTNQ